jgi:hypothetical protein
LRVNSDRKQKPQTHSRPGFLFLIKNKLRILKVRR